MDNGICGLNIISDYNISLRFMEGINLSDAIKMKRINSIYLDPIIEVAGYPQTDIQKIPMFYGFLIISASFRKMLFTFVTVY